MTRAEKNILVLYYYEEMTMNKIGAVLNMSESMISQMHASLVARLKGQMADGRFYGFLVFSC